MITKNLFVKNIFLKTNKKSKQKSTSKEINQLTVNGQ